MTVATSRYPEQISLPGQAHVADGPHDQTGMYMMHHAFRRDLARFTAAVMATPRDEIQVWTALARRWARFDEVLHHHHVIEDASIWPVLLRHADEAGNDQDQAILEAMEIEHSIIDPSLVAAGTGFTIMLDCPCEPHRLALLSTVRKLSIRLHNHLAHEESEALPILQRTVSAAEFAQMEAAAKAGYPPKLLAFLVPWVLDSLSAQDRRRIVAMAGRAYLLLYVLTRRRYARMDDVAFRYA